MYKIESIKNAFQNNQFDTFCAVYNIIKCLIFFLSVNKNHMIIV